MAKNEKKDNVEAQKTAAPVSTGADEGWKEVNTGLAEIWAPEPGDTVEGVLQSVTTARSRAGTTFQIYTLSTKAGEIGLSGAQLTRALEPIARGSELRITYLGMRDLDGGRRMRTFRVQAKEPKTVKAAPASDPA